MDNIIVTINAQYSHPKILSTIKEEEIDIVIDRIIKDFQDSYGEEEVTKEDVVIDQQVIDMFPTMFKGVKVICKSSVDEYCVWIEFHKRSYEEIDNRTLRNILQ